LAIAGNLYFVAFDLLHLNGHDLRDTPLEDRREILRAIIPKPADSVQPGAAWHRRADGTADWSWTKQSERAFWHGRT